MGFKTLLLVGGYGTRLGGLVSSLPKAMVEIGGLPFLEYLVYQLVRQGFCKLIFCIGYLGEKIREYFKDGSRWSVNIQYSEEENLLGTGGAIKKASKLFAEQNFMVMNGDSIFAIKFQNLIDYHLKKKAVATIALSKVNDVSRFGKVVVKKDGQISKFSEKGANGQGYINAGIYVLNRSILDYIPDGKECSLEKEVFPKLIGKGLFGKNFNNAFFVDIGTPESYNAIRKTPHKLLKELGLSDNILKAQNIKEYG